MESLNATPEVIRGLVDKDAQLMTGLSTMLKKSMTNEKNLHKLRDTMGKEFESLAAWETSANISKLYKEIGETFKSTSDAHLTYIKQVDEKIIPSIAGYPSRVKDLKSTLTSYEKKKAKLEKDQLNINRVPDTKRDAAQKALEKSKTDVATEIHALTGKLKSYEYNRMIDLKQVLLHNVNSEMYYHAKALEKLSALAHKVFNIDDRAEAEQMIKSIVKVEGPVQSQPQSQNPPIGQSQSQSQATSSLRQ